VIYVATYIIQMLPESRVVVIFVAFMVGALLALMYAPLTAGTISREEWYDDGHVIEDAVMVFASGAGMALVTERALAFVM
jgi:hypothetical protein